MFCIIVVKKLGVPPWKIARFASAICLTSRPCCSSTWPLTGFNHEKWWEMLGLTMNNGEKWWEMLGLTIKMVKNGGNAGFNHQKR